RRLASRALIDEAFWRIQVNFRLPSPTTYEKALWSKGKCVRCHIPCFPKVPTGRATHSRVTVRSEFPIDRGTRDDHLKAHHNLSSSISHS
ncbi:orf185 (mitochondrion), partial [Olea europaea subsp. europaea]